MKIIHADQSDFFDELKPACGVNADSNNFVWHKCFSDYKTKKGEIKCPECCDIFSVRQELIL